MRKKVCYNVSKIKGENIGLLKAFVSHWLSGFCRDSFTIIIIKSKVNECHMQIEFSCEKDCLLTILKNFPSNLASLNVKRCTHKV